MAPTAKIVIANGNDGSATELMEHGRWAAARTLIEDGARDLFGLAVD